MKIQKAKVINKNLALKLDLTKGEEVFVLTGQTRDYCVVNSDCTTFWIDKQNADMLQFIPLIDWEVIKKKWSDESIFSKLDTMAVYFWFKENVEKQL